MDVAGKNIIKGMLNMAFKVSYDSETLRIKLLYNEQYGLEKVKIRLNSGMAFKSDVVKGLEFLRLQGFVLDKRHQGRLTLEEISAFKGKTGIVQVTDKVKLLLHDKPSSKEISIDSVGIVDKDFYLNNEINYMVDFLVAFQHFYNP